MIVWVQLPAFPIHFYHREVLFSIGNLIGRTIKLDYHTQHQQRARFARIAVEVDLSKPLATRIRLDGKWQYLEYENLPILCFECGKVGHTKEVCPSSVQSAPALCLEAPGNSPAVMSAATQASEEEKEGFGPWMQVTRKSRRGSRDSTKGNSINRKGEGDIQGKGGKGKAGIKDTPVAESRPPRTTSSGNLELSAGGKAGMDRSTNPKHKGKAVVESLLGGERGKGVLGPVPKPVGPSPGKSAGGISMPRAQGKGPSSSGTKQDPPPALFVAPLTDGLEAQNSPSLTSVPSNNGTKIQIVNLPQSDPSEDPPTDKNSLSAAARTKNQKKHLKKHSSPAKTHRPVTSKALQIWTPIKGKKNKARTKIATLTLQDIEAWTEAAGRKQGEEMVGIADCDTAGDSLGNAAASTSE
ncbi:unnamed protein product [Linum tenue]|uniref:CCHC-type domain-containing protein n=1 Tax=Linum tenue TaxID=586396 RepID=A0AAV0KCM1_9ROSI|nr:unnamed protein product [Linum tenue]